MLTPILPERASGSAFIICPGGGYQGLTRHEGEAVAFWLAQLGIRAFVLKYRTAPFAAWPAPLVDVLAAVRAVRAHADEYGLQLTKVGVIGFSAGGHVAALASTRFEDPDPVSDTEDRYSSRPDAAVLAYPVITMQGDFVHTGSQKNLLGENPTQDQMDQTSAELQRRTARVKTHTAHVPLPHCRRPGRAG
ncbi:MAG: alpha/beta hydrolase [Phycisphaerae bacterium]